MKRAFSFIAFLQLLLVPFTAAAQDKKAYAAYNEESKTLTFYYDGQKEARNGMDLEPAFVMPRRVVMPWKWYVSDPIETVAFDPSMAECHSITSTAYWFYDMGSLKEIVGIENLKTENVTDMKWMFCACVNLNSIDLTKLDTRNVTDMTGMFHFCFKLSSLDMSKLDTENVKSMDGMFYYCDHLTNLDLGNLDTSSLTDVSEMFLGCSSLTSLDLSDLDTQNVTNMKDMFAFCSGLTSIDLSGFDTKNVTDMSRMFSGCTSLTSIDFSSFDTKNVTNMWGMFENCTSLTSLDLSGFDTYSVIEMEGMFRNCSSLMTIYCNDDWNVWGREYHVHSMFENCTSLKGAVSYIPGLWGVKYANPETGYFTHTPTAISLPEKSDGAQPDIYNLSGRKLAAPLRGINIIDGKIVMIK